MTTPSGTERLSEAIEEANRLCARNDGVHNMHGSRAGIEGWVRVVEMGGSVDWANVDLLLRKMRICDRTGRYPNHGELE